MSEDDIIRMARESGISAMNAYHVVFEKSQLERFAALVAAAERERCAKECEQLGCDPCTP